MTKVFFAWELGANFGHLARDLPLIRSCRARGDEVVMSAVDWRGASEFLAGEGITLVPAPRLGSRQRRPAPPVNYADMLLHAGFDDADALTMALNSWHDLFRQHRPDVIVYNHAPTALLAARLARIPVLVMGTGFEIPPTVSPLPAFRAWQNLSPSVLQDAEEKVLSQINAILTRNNRPRLERLAQLFTEAGETVLLTTFAELDPFGPRTNVRYIGPLQAMRQMPTTPWHPAARYRVLAYLRPSIPGCDRLLESLQNSHDTAVLCAMPGVPIEWKRLYSRVRFVDHPVDLAALLPQTDLVVTYGAGTMATALMAGVPVLLVPQVVEQYLAGLPLESIRAGLMVPNVRSMEQCALAVTRLLGESRFRQAAREFAHHHASFNQQDALHQLQEALSAKVDPPLP